MTPLWTHSEAARACDGDSAGEWSANGVSIDSRSIAQDDLFVAIRGPNADGHDYVQSAINAGAAAAMVAEIRPEWPTDMPHVMVTDTNKGLDALGNGARNRITKVARILGVTGSVGKTGTKEALRHVLSRQAATIATQGNLNNQWGLPLSLARMPADTVYGIFELGMNHAGEISALSKILRPHIAIITTVEPVHTEFFDSVEDIADAKAEIFDGMAPDGIAILNRDNPYFDRLQSRAIEKKLGRIISFGDHPDAEARVINCALSASSSDIQANICGESLSYRLGAPGKHWVLNSLAVLAGVKAAGGDVGEAALALANINALKGRGEQKLIAYDGGTFTLIDESYNASPASMRAAFQVLKNATPAQNGRRIAVLGDMLELGCEADAIHAALAKDMSLAGIDIAILAGTHMAALCTALPKSVVTEHGETSDAILPAVINTVRPGDVVTVKGSLGSRMAPITTALAALDETKGAANAV
jgi:UDP-N-acetylmuramoyl-tripeptide--D-alanyl-D-alanine ligase